LNKSRHFSIVSGDFSNSLASESNVLYSDFQLLALFEKSISLTQVD